MEFTTIKSLHVCAAAISYTLFLVRGIWMIRDSPLLLQRWVKVLPHVNDTILLAAGVTMAVMTRQYPGADAWLTAKVAALILYILLGMLALRPGPRRKPVRIAAWCGAQLLFAYMVGVASTRNPLLLGLAS